MLDHLGSAVSVGRASPGHITTPAISISNTPNIHHVLKAYKSKSIPIEYVKQEVEI